MPLCSSQTSYTLGTKLSAINLHKCNVTSLLLQNTLHRVNRVESVDMIPVSPDSVIKETRLCDLLCWSILNSLELLSFLCSNVGLHRNIINTVTKFIL